ncbi:30S ribosomal protein S10 [Pseudomonas sp. FW300-N1B4]|uniref:30S ribosomal protein n=2 Tax=Pseudomonas fluorescens TaxID=294 RepID=A0A166QRI0_PSEFL|nr:30S ribosomal protein [Pseudomonas fluorescens]
MFTQAKDYPAWDLAVPKSMRNRFSAESFYIVIDGLSAEPVRATSQRIKSKLGEDPSVRVRGPLSLPTVRRRHMVMREMQAQGSKGQFIAHPKRHRQVLLVVNPTSASVSGLISLSIPTTVNVKVEHYRGQFDLKEDR